MNLTPEDRNRLRFEVARAVRDMADRIEHGRIESKWLEASVSLLKPNMEKVLHDPAGLTPEDVTSWDGMITLQIPVEAVASA